MNHHCPLSKRALLGPYFVGGWGVPFDFHDGGFSFPLWKWWKICQKMGFLIVIKTSCLKGFFCKEADTSRNLISAKSLRKKLAARKWTNVNDICARGDISWF